MSSLSRSAAATIASCIAVAMKKPGGARLESIPSPLRQLFGHKLASCSQIQRSLRRI